MGSLISMLSILLFSTALLFPMIYVHPTSDERPKLVQECDLIKVLDTENIQDWDSLIDRDDTSGTPFSFCSLESVYHCRQLLGFLNTYVPPPKYSATLL